MENKWGDYGRYDAWFSGDLNNAQLSTVVSYNTLVPFFTKILDESDDITMFYAEVEKLAELEEAERRERVKAN
jgi:predicted aminopeptidase